MASNEQIVGYFDELGFQHKELGPGLWMIQDASGMVQNIIVHHDAPLVMFRVKVMNLPDEGSNEAMYKQLLEYNATDMIHGAYALEEKAIVAVDTLQSETLDIGELQGSVDSLALAMTTHLPRLAAFLKAS